MFKGERVNHLHSLSAAGKREPKVLKSDFLFTRFWTKDIFVPLLEEKSAKETAFSDGKRKESRETAQDWTFLPAFFRCFFMRFWFRNFPDPLLSHTTHAFRFWRESRGRGLNERKDREVLWRRYNKIVWHWELVFVSSRSVCQTIVHSRLRDERTQNLPPTP